ncbi:MAG: HlyD family efflux transporter periplasmic adaptor subunit [Deltaproteobacteria bacterium]|nr:HlyD family efflux transporter periplasmic adaptor subunit [Deltaproteobacteria bacterium]
MKKGFMFKFLRVVIVIIVAVVIAVLLITLRPKAQRQVPAEKGRLVETMTVKAEDINMTIEAYGTVKAREALKLVAEVRGRIVKVDSSFKEGNFVKKGTALIKIDPRTYRLEVERRRVQVSQAKAELMRLEQEVKNLKASIKIAKSDALLAQNEFTRLKKLINKNVIAQTTLDKTEQRYLSSLERLQGLENQMALTGPLKDQYEAQRNMAKVSLKQAKLDLQRSIIVAHSDSWVLEKGIEEGQHVNAGQYLGSIYRDRALDIEVRIPVKDLKWFPPDMSPESMPEVKIILESEGSSISWKGHVARIKAQMDQRTRTLPVVVEIDEDKGAGKDSGNRSMKSVFLRPGTFVTVMIKGRKVEKAFLLPRHVVRTGDVVYTVKDNKLKIQPVSIMRSFKESVFIDKGLNPGDLIISTPLSGAADGMLVRVKQ